MSRKLLFISIGLILLTASGVMAQWDNHKMHFPQLPDENGWGISRLPERILADDWQCSESGPVRDLHFWGKWFAGFEGTIDHFDITIYADIPADPPLIPFSRPGEILWEYDAFEFATTSIPQTSPGGWYNPITGEVLSDIQQDYYQYDIYFDDQQTWFEQVEGTIYWIEVFPAADLSGWGWLSSINHWNDNAIFWNLYEEEWIELYEPGSDDPLDLAFVITADASATDMGACCYPEPTGSGDMLCIETNQANCENNLLGTYRGDGTQCQPMEACCLPNSDCIMADPSCCANELLGTPMGVGTSCTALEACCFDDGSCQNLDPLCCVEMGGDPRGPGSDCATTECNAPPKNWYQAPDLSESGINVNCNYPMGIIMDPPRYVLADDFQCNKTEPITEIHIWGTWYNNFYPDWGSDFEGDPGLVTFRLSLHADIPAGVLEQWSMPGEMIAEWQFEPGEFIYKEVSLANYSRGWLDPPTSWSPEAGGKCWEYIFFFDESNWFVQEGSEQEPVIYWFDIQAFSQPAQQAQFTTTFGWKTSTDHWNDDAVWFEGEDLPVQLPWQELRYPEGHQYYPESIDLAFMIGGPCDCQPGEADGNTTEINILDIVHLVNYKYKGGVDPIPYALCSGDVNCNCTVDILDIVYLINFKYKGGNAPCTCGSFLINCGIPLR
ncbi:MAG: hypothetical protein GY865_13530 [candidate division Zixibacteria bacterium]|nr:hypothetical protein [candidate division Zixibacteria bacterium]